MKKISSVTFLAFWRLEPCPIEQSIQHLYEYTSNLSRDGGPANKKSYKCDSGNSVIHNIQNSHIQHVFTDTQSFFGKGYLNLTPISPVGCFPSAVSGIRWERLWTFK